MKCISFILGNDRVQRITAMNVLGFLMYYIYCTDLGQTKVPSRSIDST